MAIQIFYESGKDATYSDITAYYRSNTLDVSMGAEEGNAEQSTIEFEDPEGDLEIVGWRRMYIFETSAATGYQLIGGFWTGDRSISRAGSNAAFHTGAGRVWKVSLIDQNAILHMRMMVTNAKRGAESDEAFVTWLMSHPSMSRILDTSKLLTGSPVQMSAKRDYTGQKGVEALDDAAQQSGKNYYAYTVDGGATPFDMVPGVWYGSYDAPGYDSTLSISNVDADIDESLCFAPSDDTELVRSPQRVFSGGYGQYDGAAVYRERAATHVEFTRRDTPIAMANVKTAAVATARVNRELADIATEEDVITTTIIVPPAKVNLAREGMRIGFRAQHFPGYESQVMTRILKRQVKHWNFQYMNTMTLAKPTPGTTTALCSNLTASGSHYPLGGSAGVANVSDGYSYYLRPGIEYPTEPDPGHQGVWHFPVYGAGGSGTVDQAGDCGQNIVRCMVVGDGSISVHTSTVSSSRNLIARLCHADTGVPGGVVVDEYQEGTTGDTFTFTVSTHGGLSCTHWVDVGDTGSTCGGKWGYNGFDWTAA